MAHDHAAHSHGVSPSADRGKLAVALGLIIVFMAFEVAAGIVSHSLALLSDAGHMFGDAAAIGFSLVALQLAARPAKGAMTFGLRRLEILSAQANGVTLLILAAFIAYEAVRRLFAPLQVRGGLMLAVALVGIAVNLAAVWTLARANRSSLNVQGSYQHVLTDLYGFIGTAVAAAVILLAGFERADPIASLLIAALMIRAGISLLLASGRIFLEAAPRASTPRRSDARSSASTASSRCTTCTYGKYPAAFPPSRPTCSWRPRATATTRGASWRPCCARVFSWITRRCRSIIAASSCWTSSFRARAPPRHARPDVQPVCRRTRPSA